MTLLFLKSKSSRKINDEKHCQEEFEELYYKGSLDDKSGKPCSCLTVWRKSLLMNCTGFTVIDSSNGNLVYRVDNYCVRPGEIVLMDASGASIFSMRRQKSLRLVDDWLVYKGDVSGKNPKTCEKKQPICYVKKNVSLLQANSNVLAHVFLGTSTKKPTYVIEGSYGQRSCSIFDKSSKKIVAEIKRKEARSGFASFGQEVFQLMVWPGFDSGFAMTLVLVLDQMFS